MAIASSQEAFGTVGSTRTTLQRHYLARTNASTGTSMECAIMQASGGPNPLGGSGGQTHPHPGDSKTHVARLEINDPTANIIRGTLRGAWQVLHDNPFNDLDTFTGTILGVVRSFIYFRGGGTASICIETSDTWNQ